MPRRSNNPPALPDGAQPGATQRNNQKNAPPLDLINYLFDKELSPRQRKAIELLLRGLSDAQTAAEVGVDRGTVYRWRTDDAEFIEVLETQRRILWQQSAQRLQTMYQPALDILEKQLTGPDPRLALRAAALLLRVASPARLDRVVRDTSPPAPPPLRSTPRSPRRSADDNAFAAFLDAYINAPLPGDAGRECDANANALPQFGDEDLNDDEDEEDDVNDAS
jgi:Helix-turn-helix of insertion element transposase